MSPSTIRLTISKGLHPVVLNRGHSNPKTNLMAKLAEKAKIARLLQEKGDQYQQKFIDFLGYAARARDPAVSPEFFLSLYDEAEEMAVLLSEIFELLDRQSGSASKSPAAPSQTSADALDELSSLAATLSITESEKRGELVDDFVNALGKLSLF